MKALNLTECTVHGILKEKEKIKNVGKLAASLQSKKLSRVRPGIMIEMERLLQIFVEDNAQKAVPISTAIIQAKTLSLYEDLKEKLPPNDVQFCVWVYHKLIFQRTLIN